MTSALLLLCAFAAMLAPALASETAASASVSGTLAAPGVAWISDGSLPAPDVGAAISQKDRAFAPEFSVVNAGTIVRFRNEDDTDHSVYSLSPADPFDIGIYEPGPGKDVAFARSGIVEIRCHIHRHMHATLIVVDGPYARIDAADGAPWRIAGVRPGRHLQHVWTAERGETTKLVDVR